jgi:hypothetical protein
LNIGRINNFGCFSAWVSDLEKWQTFSGLNTQSIFAEVGVYLTGGLDGDGDVDSSW